MRWSGWVLHCLLRLVTCSRPRRTFLLLSALQLHSQLDNQSTNKTMTPSVTSTVGTPGVVGHGSALLFRAAIEVIPITCVALASSVRARRLGMKSNLLTVASAVYSI